MIKESNFLLENEIRKMKILFVQEEENEEKEGKFIDKFFGIQKWKQLIFYILLIFVYSSQIYNKIFLTFPFFISKFDSNTKKSFLLKGKEIEFESKISFEASDIISL